MGDASASHHTDNYRKSGESKMKKMSDDFNKGFRRGYDAALQDLNAFLDLTGSIRDHTKDPDSNDVLSSLLTHPYGTEEDGIQEPLKQYAEYRSRRHTCSQCSCWLDNHLNSIFCKKTYRRVSDCDTACDQFKPRIEGEENDEEDERSD